MVRDFMYFKNISDAELNFFHGIEPPSFSIKLTTALSSDLFKIETIIADKLYKLYPLFYCESITSSNVEDKILDNKCIICKKETKETLLTFITDDTGVVEDYVDFMENGTGLFGIGDSLTDAEYNSIVQLLRNNNTINKPIKFSQSTIQGDYGEYDFSIKTGFVDKGILINANHLTTDSDFHVRLSNSVFKTSSYTLHMKAMRISNVNVTDENSEDNITYIDVNVGLVDGVYVHIPTDDLQVGDILLYDCSININHDAPVIQDWITDLSLRVEPEIIQIGETSTLTAKGTDSLGQNITGKTIYFYELFEPLLDLKSDKSIGQIGDVVNFSIALKDESDGSILDEDSVVLLYEVVNRIYDDCTGTNINDIWIGANPSEVSYYTLNDVKCIRCQGSLGVIDVDTNIVDIEFDYYSGASWGGIHLKDTTELILVSQGSQTNDSGAKIFYKVNSNTWTHIKMEVRPTTIKLYVEGSLIDTKSVNVGEHLYFIGGSTTNTFYIKNILIEDAGGS